MNKEIIKAPYVGPTAELVLASQPLHLLVSVSIDAGLEDWEEGDEL